MAFAVAVSPITALAEAIAFTDAAQRHVTVPADPARVLAAGPPAATLLYVLKPGAMIGWVRIPKDADRAFLRPEAAALPELGRLTGKGDTVNLEMLLRSKPDLILDYGTVSPIYSELADRVQAQSGLPYVLLDGSFAQLPASLRAAGRLLGVEDRAEAIATDAEATLAATDALLAQIPEDERPRVYLARGADGLETAAKGSINAEIIERAGGRNVAETGTRGLVTVSAEQVQAWAPDVIITIDKDFAARVAAMPEWQGIPAVRDHRVYLAPSAPFGFIDAPPSVNRLIGLKWLLHKFYPEHAIGDIKEEVSDFYRLYYGVTPDAAALGGLLGD